MMKKIVMLILAGAVIGLVSYVCEAQEKIITPLDINVKAQKSKKAKLKRGNIFTIHVGKNFNSLVTKEKKEAAHEVSKETYNIMYYLDGNFIKQFDNKKLPFVFRRNLRGQAPGKHEIRVDIENKEGDVLAREKTIVNVLKEKKESKIKAAK